LKLPELIARIAVNSLKSKWIALRVGNSMWKTARFAASQPNLRHRWIYTVICSVSPSYAAMTDYTPIDCALHSEYELAIVHGLHLRISWSRPDGRRHVEVLKPRDLKTRNHEEYLIAEQPDGQQLEIRLDRIRKIEPIPGAHQRD
jgi:Rho-binding antiterminator